MSWTADEAYLAHHGIKGQKWGVRRFQEKDGDYTTAGRARYGVGSGEKKPRWRQDMASGSSKNYSRKIKRELNKMDQQQANYKGEISDRMPALEYSQNKRAKAMVKNNQKAVDRAQKSINKTEAKINVYSDAIKESKRKTEQLIKEAEAAGYTINSAVFNRYATTGSDIVAAMNGVTVIRDPYKGKYYSVNKKN